MSDDGNEQNDLRINVERVGRGPETIDEVRRASLEHPSIRERLRGKRSRLLSVQLVEADGKGKDDEPATPDRYRATIYDYTNNQAVVATGRLDDIRGSLEVSVAGSQPIPTRDEFEEAVEVLLEDEDLGPAIRNQRLAPYRPMPPLVEAELPNGRVGRTVAVGPPYAAGIDRFWNGEDVSDQNVVVWYAAHFVHDVGEEEEHSHYVGPILRPANW